MPMLPNNPLDFTLRVRTGPLVVSKDESGEEIEAKFATVELDGHLVWAGTFSQLGVTGVVEDICSRIVVDGYLKEPY